MTDVMPCNNEIRDIPGCYIAISVHIQSITRVALLLCTFGVVQASPQGVRRRPHIAQLQVSMLRIRLYNARCNAILGPKVTF